MPKLKLVLATLNVHLVTGTGEFKRAKTFKATFLKKSPARKRNLRKTLVAKLTTNA